MILCAGVMELADVMDSKSIVGDNVPVRVRPPAPIQMARWAIKIKQAGIILACFYLPKMANSATLRRNQKHTKGAVSMKKLLLCAMLITMLLGGCTPTNNQEAVQEAPEGSQLFPFAYERPANPSAAQREQMAIIRYILKNTYENNIHKMRGETENVVYVNEDGREAVYDKNGNMVTNSYNQGSFNYYANETEPIKKFIFDITPWLLWGNTQEDPTTFEERLYYYTLDLDYGIQSYIFGGAEAQEEIVAFDELPADEKEVYYMFLGLLFHKDYAITLSPDNRERLQKDSAYYFAYFHQIQETLHVRQ